MQLFIFLESIFSFAKAKFKGDQDSFNENSLTPRQLLKLMNIFDENPKLEYNKDHTRKHVVFDNDVFDRLFGNEERETIPVHVPSEEEVKDKKKKEEFEVKKDKNSSFIRRILGISA